MRRSKVPLQSLSEGRCFTLPREPGAPDASEERPTGATLAVPILGPEAAWKVVAAGDPVRAQSARGETQEFDPALEVVEIPRQGYETLAGR